MLFQEEHPLFSIFRATWKESVHKIFRFKKLTFRKVSCKFVKTV